MVIDSNNNITSGAGNLRSKSGTAGVDSAGTASKQSTQATGQEGRDSVSLSSEAQSLARLEAKINAASDSNSDRIAAIKQAIEDGTYEINAERIANQMLDQDDLLA